jgi:diguanylate cyclase (GGDEF)-like protein
VRGAGIITVLLGGLPLLVAWIAGLTGFLESHRPVTNVIAEVLALLLIVLAWRFRRGRLAVAALLIGASNYLVRGPLAEAPTGAGATVLVLAVPILLALLALLPERPIRHFQIVALTIAVLTLSSIAAAASGAVSPAAGNHALTDLALFLAAPDVARLVFLIATAFVALAFAARREAFEGALLWVLAAAALALLPGRDPDASALALGAAQVVLLLGVIEDSYRLAYHDQLTELPGRRALEETLQSLEGDYAIAMVDVDHFKRFNDRHGHKAGDEALRMVATELRKVKGGGRAFRYGGEEFTIVFPGATPAASREHLEGVRSAIANRKFALRAQDRPRKKPDRPKSPVRSARLISVAVSIGVAGPDARHSTPDTVLRAADRALYRAKNAGRNRVVADGDTKSVTKR